MARAILALALVAVCSCASDPASKAPADPAQVRGDSYYLGTCAACDGRLGYGGEAESRVAEGRALRFCGQECAQRFEAEPATVLAHADAVIARDQAPHYPVDTSIVSGKALGAAPTDVVWGNRLVRLAGEGERARFLKDPERYVRLLDAEVVRVQTPTYGMPNRCPVQGDILSNDIPLDIVVANRMVRVCCVRCARTVRARPSQYLALVDYANREAARPADP